MAKLEHNGAPNLEFICEKAGKYLIFSKGSHENRRLVGTITRFMDKSIQPRWYAPNGAAIFDEKWKVEWFDVIDAYDEQPYLRHRQPQVFDTLPSIHDALKFINYPGYQCVLDRNRNGKGRIKR